MSQDRISDTGLVVTRNAAGKIVMSQNIKAVAKKVSTIGAVETYTPAQFRAFARIKRQNAKEIRRIYKLS